MQEFLIKQIPVKLCGDLKDLPALTFMCEPCMLKIRSDQYQFQLFNLLYVVADHPFRPCTVLNKVEFEFLMNMQGKIKF